MATVQTINPSNAIKALRETYGNEVAEKVMHVVERYNLRSTKQLLPGNASLYTQYNREGIQGTLRFAENGDVYDGLVETSTLPKPATRLLFALAFGPNSLKNPPSSFEAKLDEGGKMLYDCYQMDTNDQNQCIISARSTITNGLILFVKQLLDVATEEDEGPGGWDPDDFSGIIAEHSGLMAALSANTLEGSAQRLALANEIVLQSISTESGAWACEKLGECTKQETYEYHTDFSKPLSERGCTEPVTHYYFRDKEVRKITGVCSR